MIPHWLNVPSWIFVALGLVTMGAIAADVHRHPQRMTIMNVVWPITALYIPVAGWWLYDSMGRPMAAGVATMERGGMNLSGSQSVNGRTGYWPSIFGSALHCGAGCVVGDVIGAPVVKAMGWTVFGEPLFAEYSVEFAIAYVFGIAFQYIPIRSVRRVPRHVALIDAVKSETLALIAYEIGLFGWMAVPYFLLFPQHPPEVETIAFWFVMQIRMTLGLLTSYPANW